MLLERQRGRESALAVVEIGHGLSTKVRCHRVGKSIAVEVAGSNGTGVGVCGTDWLEVNEAPVAFVSIDGALLTISICQEQVRPAIAVHIGNRDRDSVVCRRA